jgi:hypothetical protein
MGLCAPGASAIVVLLTLACAAFAADDSSDWTAASPELTHLATERGLLGRCDIRVVENASAMPCAPGPGGCTAFADLFARREPFVLRGYTQHWRAHQLWSREYMYRVHGSSRLGSDVESQKATYNSFGIGVNAKGGAAVNGAGTLSDYLDQMRSTPDDTGPPSPSELGSAVDVL